MTLQNQLLLMFILFINSAYADTKPTKYLCRGDANYLYIIFDKEYLLFSIKWFAGTTIGIFLFYKHIWNFILSSILPDRKKFDVYSNI